MSKSLVILALIGIVAAVSNAQAPDSLSFQGHLTNPAGAALDTTVSMTFKMYKGTSKIWEQTHGAVTVSNGRFNVLLGGTGTASLDTVAFNQPIDLGITIGGESELSPRTPLAASAYALGMRGMYSILGKRGSNIAPNLIGGSPSNYVKPTSIGATISGGGGWAGSTFQPDSVVADWGTIGGGGGNSVKSSYGTIGGGRHNTAGALYATVGGGTLNAATGAESTVSGGEENTADELYATVSGGTENLSGGLYSTVGGGKGNEATGLGSTISGGTDNSATSTYSTVSGGLENSASGSYSAVLGGRGNSARSSNSVAVGYKARSKHQGTFVWNDRSVTVGDDSLVSTASNQFLIRAVGGVGIGTNAPSNQLSVAGSADIAGNLGIGTDAPIAKLHIDGASGSASGLKLEANEDDQFSIYYSANTGVVIDSYKPAGARRLPLLFQPGGGDVGIGVTTPSTRLHVYGSGTELGGVPPFDEVVARVQGTANTALSIDAPGTSDPLLYFANGGVGIWSLRNDAPSNVFQLRKPGAPSSAVVVEIQRTTEKSWLRPGVDNALDLGTSANRWRVVYAADGTINTSDGRLKRDVTPLNYGLDELLQLVPIRYRWKDEPDEARLGFTAQDVEFVLPEVVARPESEDGHYGMNYSELIPVLVRAIQEQQAEIEQMRAAMERAGLK